MQQQETKSKQFLIKQAVDINKIGLCGIPSIWLSKEQLMKQGYLQEQNLNEDKRMDQLLKILKAHRKWENEKFYGSNFKRAGSFAHAIQNQKQS